jgi:hypothetical protein
MKKLNIFKIAVFIAVTTTSLHAQVISEATLHSSVAGGARILDAQGNTAASPAIGFQSSVSAPGLAQEDGGGGNGIFRPLANTMAFATASLERMRIDVSGDVIIGTSTPLARFTATTTPGGLPTAIVGKGINTGVYGEATDMNAPLTEEGILQGWTEAIGVFGKGTYASNVGNGNIYGVAGSAAGTNPLNNCGIYGEAKNATGYNTGVFGAVNSTTGIYNTGIAGLVGLNTSAVWNIAVSGKAPVAPNHFAGYFDGKVAIVDGTQANNYVLTSDANGLATWTDPCTLPCVVAASGSDWHITGNAATNPITDFLGTTDAQPLTIKTSNTDRAIITATGEMGVGTTTPTAQLEVSSTNVTNPAVIVNGKSVGVYAESTDQSSALIKRSNEYGDLDGIAVFGNAKFVSNTTNGSMYGVVGSATEVNPLNNLGVMGEGKNASGYNTGVYGYVNSTTGLYNTGVAGEVKLNPTAVWSRAINGLAPVAPNHYAGYFDGNVDIKSGVVTIGDGTLCTPTGYKLFVEQGILTEKVKVAVNCSSAWADYVFANDYKLKPLSEVETYLKENKHLPNVPSADELVKDGLDLGKMQATQMEKIEELTLYMIEMKKEINTLKNENQSLKTLVSQSKN